MELWEAIDWLVAGGGAGVLAYYILREMDREGGWFFLLPPHTKRYVTFALAGGFAAALAALGLGGAIAMHYKAPMPWREWVEVLFKVALASILASQGLHGSELKARYEALKG